MFPVKLVIFNSYVELPKSTGVSPAPLHTKRVVHEKPRLGSWSSISTAGGLAQLYGYPPVNKYGMEDTLFNSVKHGGQGKPDNMTSQTWLTLAESPIENYSHGSFQPGQRLSKAWGIPQDCSSRRQRHASQLVAEWIAMNAPDAEGFKCRD